jgi:hypothetical protein
MIKKKKAANSQKPDILVLNIAQKLFFQNCAHIPFISKEETG